MANVDPWGSENIKAFLTKLGAADADLLSRVVEFVDEINVVIGRNQSGVGGQSAVQSARLPRH